MGIYFAFEAKGAPAGPPTRLYIAFVETQLPARNLLSNPHPVPSSSQSFAKTEMSSKQEESEAPLTTKQALAIALGAAAIASRWSLPLAGQASTKPFPDFASFYPHYLHEHSNPTTRLLHYVGTSILLANLVKTPNLIPGLVGGIAVGHSILFPLTSGMQNGLAEMAAMLGLFAYSGKKMTGSWQKTLSPVVIAYGFAWIGWWLDWDLLNVSRLSYPCFLSSFFCRKESPRNLHLPHFQSDGRLQDALWRDQVDPWNGLNLMGSSRDGIGIEENELGMGKSRIESRHPYFKSKSSINH